MLYQRIDVRVGQMIAAGLLDETRRLVAQYGSDIPAMSGLGYAQIAAHLRDETTLEEAIAAIKRATRRFVRHQSNWFKPSDPLIQWYDASRPEQATEAIEQVVREWLAAGR
jgi:tRNA dimethylallyltransferase